MKLLSYFKSFYETLLYSTSTVANIASFLTIGTLISFVYIGYWCGVIPLRLALYLLYPLFIFLYYKFFFKALEFTIPKLPFVWSALSIFFPLYGIILLEMLGLGDGFLLIALEINDALNKKPVEIDRNLFEDFERIESKGIESEEEVDEEVDEEIEKKNPKFKTGVFLFGVGLFIIIKIVVLVFIN